MPAAPWDTGGAAAVGACARKSEHGGGTARCVDGVDFAVSGGEEEAEEVAADAGAGGFGYAEGGGGGDSRILRGFSGWWRRERRGVTAALPPDWRMRRPACAARGWVQETMPLVECTTERRVL